MRFPLVRRSTMEAALDAQLGRYNGLMGEKEHEIVRLREENARLKAEFAAWPEEKATLETALSDAETRRDKFFDVAFDLGQKILGLIDDRARVREHFDATVKAKDEAYAILHDSREALLSSLDVLESDNASLAYELSGLGIATPFDWAYPLPCWLSTIVTAGIRGVCGEVGGMGGDPDGDDPRYNMGLPLGLKACSVPDSST